MRTGRLHASSEEELEDLAVWLEHHPEDLTHEVRFEAIDFLRQTAGVVAEAPMVIYVPTHLVDAIRGVIDDWAEVLSAHNESLETHLVIP